MEPQLLKAMRKRWTASDPSHIRAVESMLQRLAQDERQQQQQQQKRAEPRREARMALALLLAQERGASRAACGG